MSCGRNLNKNALFQLLKSQQAMQHVSSRDATGPGIAGTATADRGGEERS